MMKKPQGALWDDGRSGPAGCAAGNLALSALGKAEAPIAKLKGTTFESNKAFLIGRVCASDAYLEDPVLHWANASWDQHVELERVAQEAGKALFYLFVTASSDPTTVRYWRVPAKVVQSVFVARGRDRRGSTCAIHITAGDGKHYIGASEVTRFCTLVPLRAGESSALREAFQASTRASGSAAGPGVKAGGVAQLPPLSGITSFDIPAAQARTIRVQVRLPLAPADLDRLKQWIDLMADVLTERPDHLRRLDEEIQVGLDALERADTVDGEQAFDRLLNRRRRTARKSA